MFISITDQELLYSLLLVKKHFAVGLFLVSLKFGDVDDEVDDNDWQLKCYHLLSFFFVPKENCGFDASYKVQLWLQETFGKPTLTLRYLPTFNL